MGYKALIDANLRKAFNLVQDLAVTVKFNKVVNPDFDFTTNAVVDGDETVIETKAVIVESKKKAKDKNTKYMELLFKTQDIGEVSLYDSVLVNGETWKLDTPISTDGFVTLLLLVKEG